MPTEVVVVGAGGFGREVLDVIEAHNAACPNDALRVLGVADDAPSEANLQRLTNRGYAHLGSLDDIMNSGASAAYVLGVANPPVKRVLASKLERAGWFAVGVAHPAAIISPTATLGEGAIVCGGVQISTNTKLGRHVHVNPNVTIGHDAVLGDYASVNPGAIVSGEVAVGDAVLIGAGAVVLQGLKVGSGAIVGASACVTRDVAPGATAVGVPARARAGAHL